VIEVFPCEVLLVEEEAEEDEAVVEILSAPLYAIVPREDKIAKI